MHAPSCTSRFPRFAAQGNPVRFVAGRFLSLVTFAALLGAAAPLRAEVPDTMPEPLVMVMPKVSYTYTGMVGEIKLHVDINADGYVTHADILSSTQPGMNEACLAAIRGWRYAPGTKGGVKVPASFVQPFTFEQGLITTVETSPSAQRAKAIHHVAPVLPEALRHVTGEVMVAVDLDEQGGITHASIASSSHAALNAPCLEAIHAWRFSPEIENGKASACKVSVPFDFAGDSLSVEETAAVTSAKDSELQPILQASPELPAGLDKVAGEAEIAFIVDRFGYVVAPEVISATNPAFGASARQAVLNWTYRPTLKNGQPVAVRVVQPFRFNATLLTTDSRDALDQLPWPVETVQPVLPENLRHVIGRVMIEFKLDPRGGITAVETKDATRPELAGPALVAAKAWKFHAASKDGHPAAATVTVPFVFGS